MHFLCKKCCFSCEREKKYALTNNYEKNTPICMTKRKRKNGLHTRYYDNGQQLSEEHYNDGMLEGKWTFWYENMDSILKNYFMYMDSHHADPQAIGKSAFSYEQIESEINNLLQ